VASVPIGSPQEKEVPPPESSPIADASHPDFVHGVIAEGESALTGAFVASEQPVQLPDQRLAPLFLCGPVSGRYQLASPPLPPWGVPFRRLFVTVRVDVDRFYPQQRISIDVERPFPNARGHVIAVVTSDRCAGFNHRTVNARIDYRDGDPSLIPGDALRFEARRTIGTGYGAYSLTLLSAGAAVRTYQLNFVSTSFDNVEFEVDVVDNAGAATTTYDTGSHPNRPTTLAVETLSFDTTYRRAGFNVTISPNASTLPVLGAGANGTWSDTEMHNAMIAFWSRFADRPQWAMWVLFAARHDQGRSLGGVMFDDIGANHRQGTAIFTDSFIQDVPSGDPNPAAWRRRMVYWTAIHEMGHAFNLAHAWQKSLGRPQVDGDPWIPLADAPESRSFMNYPFRVTGGQQSFFSDFAFRFTDDELIFMRHAPRRFVQMGNENWFEHHGFERSLQAASGLTLQLRPNRNTNSYAFLEPVHLELKLSNASPQPLAVDADAISDGRHIAVAVQREGGEVRKWRPFITYCHESLTRMLSPGEAIYASHFVGASPEGWLIDEPGFYHLQAAVLLNGEVVRSNPLRIFVGPTSQSAENRLAPDYFEEDVARALAFHGAPDLPRANDVLREVVERCPANPAATHAAVALAAPDATDFKVLRTDGGRAGLEIRARKPDVDKVVRLEVPKFVKNVDASAETLGHIRFRQAGEDLSEALADAGATKEATAVQKSVADTMEKRGVLPAVVKASRQKLTRLAKGR
jgi:hypothetical protein